MEISNSAWRELQHSLTEDFVDLLLPPTYAFCVDTRYPRTAGMEALIKDRLTSIDFPEQKILNLDQEQTINALGIAGAKPQALWRS